ncbi:hypothetical protein BCR32DRAFT_263658 [Anaeromyces robustus]|uniref:Uncharacterized protein n=1 Tax=Anaeromyces robustus TaxID=1754192 RepID=A0A1Y1XRC1_9FUNG|nr:hypothetical protein BCR32DRAFT_263658 [Anaeromyces robustus]|eukprot:ORX88205.1 hypothetical protein BCR32DRAFT_263658 [Anaeromyces robustus]
MKFIITLLCALITLIGLVITEPISISEYTKELFSVHLIETKKYNVNGNTCNIEMIYIEGTCDGDYFNGELIFKDSSTVIKRFKDGKIELTSRYYINGTDNESNAGHLHIEDNLLGFDDNEQLIVVPTIITDIESLAWLQTADIIGIVEKTDNGDIIHYMWNENNATKKSYPVTKIPDETKNYTKNILTVDVVPGGLGFETIQGVEGTFAGKFGFTCFVNTTQFQGEGVDYFVDTRHSFPGQIQALSARYIIEGIDDEGNKMKIYIENNGVDETGYNDNVRTEPLIITDNPKWAWIETAPLHGNMTMEDSIQILFWTVEGANQIQQQELPIDSEIKESPEIKEALELPEEPVVTIDTELSTAEESEFSTDEEIENISPVNTNEYTEEIFTVNLIETQKYNVNGSTCDVEMIYIDGTCGGEYFNGELIFKDSSNVIKRFKNGKIELTSRYYINGTDNENNAGHLHIEDNYLGFDNNEQLIVVPTIITDIENLAWLQTADIIGIVEEIDVGKVIHYMWNENNTTKKPYPVTKIPDETKNYTKNILTVDVVPGGLGFETIQGVEGTFAGKFGFTCFVNTTQFQGEGVDYFVDTRHSFPGQIQALSARYIIEGIDDEGNKMKIYIENNGVDETGYNDNVRTEPLIITDNPKWAWIETAPLHGNMTMEDSIQILFWTVEGADHN